MPTIPFPASPLSIAARSMDVAHFDRIANDPDVRPSLGGGDVPIDLAKAGALEVRNYAFKTTNGGFLLWALGSGRYDVHSLFLPAGRGPEACAAMREVSAYMFTHTDCTEGRTTVPEGNSAAMALALRGGFEKRFELERMPWTPEGGTVKATFLALTLEKWALTSQAAKVAGHWFHDCLSAAKDQAGSMQPIHPDEAVHDAMVGAVVLMTLGGQAAKAVAFYNAWALTTRYAPIALISKAPVVIDLVDAVVEAGANHMEILLCR